MLSRLVTPWLAIAIFAAPTFAGGPKTGPVIEAYGPVFETPADALRLQPGVAYKVSMDVAATADKPTARNRNLESAARFLNMNAGNAIEFALIVHGPAARDLLRDEAYSARFQSTNPNADLLTALGAAGVTIYICGQTAAYRGYAPADFHPAVRQADSAMTAHVRLQAEGYTLIPF